MRHASSIINLPVSYEMLTFRHCQTKKLKCLKQCLGPYFQQSCLVNVDNEFGNLTHWKNAMSRLTISHRQR